MLAQIADGHALVRIVLVGFVGGAGFVAVFSLLVLGGQRLQDARGSEGESTALTTAGYALVVLACAALCLAALAVGFWAMTKKS